MRKLLRIFALILAALLALAPCALAEFAAQVRVTRMYVYADEGLTSKLGSLKQNTIVTVESYANGVARISYMGRSGYAAVSSMKALSGEAREATINARVRVYQSARTSSRSTVLKKGATVNLLMTSGSWAMIEKNGYIGYLAKKYVTVAAPSETVPSPSADVVYATFEAEVSADSLPVYASADTASQKLGTLKKGALVTVVAYNQTWACLKNDKTYGFARRSGLKKAGAAAPTAPAVSPTPTPTPTPTPAPTSGTSFSDAVKSGKYSNEELIFIFLTKEMKLNTAAACGILSNIWSESNFIPTVYYQGSYGICQWLGSRKTKMQNFCSTHGYDYTTLTGQLYYLQEELKEYPKVLSYMQNVENSASGAYDAGYYWCYYYEIPASRSSASEKRGARARDTYWPKYK